MALIEQAAEQQQITPKILTLHADRGAPQRAKPVAFLLADLGITKTHWWILAVVATVGELSISRVSLCVRIILIGELYLSG
jgi:hypothetical protein